MTLPSNSTLRMANDRTQRGVRRAFSQECNGIQETWIVAISAA
jgi:hypothetical protein